VQQAIGSVDSVFGKNAGQVKQWANSAATDVGLAKSEYMELASVMGAQLKNMGVPLDQVASKTNDLVGLGSDLAATYGGTTKEAVEALGSALRGVSDPIERYGVSVKQADIAAQQAKDGTDKLTGAAGKQAKTMALLSLVNKQTADAQGQFNEEQDTAAVQAQITAAKYEDMQAALGTALLPAITAVTNVLGRLAGVMTKHKTITLVVIAVIAAMAAAILLLNVAVGVYTAVTTLAASATIAAWVAAAWPILAVVAAVALVIGVVVLLWKKNATFRNAVLATWRAIKGAAIAVARAVKAAWSATWNAIQSAARSMGSAVRAVWNSIKAVARAVVGSIKSVWLGLWNALRSGARSAVAAVKAAITGVKGTASSIVTSIKNLFSGMWSAIKAGARGVGEALAAPFHTAMSAAQSLINLVEKIISAIGRIKMPSLKMPNLPGPLGRSVAAVGAPVPVGRYAAPTGRSGRLTATPMVAGGPTIVIQGALDPEAVARQVQRLLGKHDRRIGVTVA
jgi:hypothetical protein